MLCCSVLFCAVLSRAAPHRATPRCVVYRYVMLLHVCYQTKACLRQNLIVSPVTWWVYDLYCYYEYIIIISQGMWVITVFYQVGHWQIPYGMSILYFDIFACRKLSYPDTKEGLTKGTSLTAEMLCRFAWIAFKSYLLFFFFKFNFFLKFASLPLWHPL